MATILLPRDTERPVFSGRRPARDTWSPMAPILLRPYSVRHPFRLDPEARRGMGLHALTLCTHNRRRYFRQRQVVDLVLLQILRSAEPQDWALPAYCFMPDHLPGFAFRRAFREALWQRSYHDRTLRKHENLPGAIWYLINNPVRAGLVEQPADYPYWGSGTYSRDELLEYVRVAARPV